MIAFRSGSATDVGMVRESNQDACLLADPLFAVADGMGGHKGGEVASATALDILEETFTASGTRDDLIEAVRRANSKVWDKAQLNENLRGMGTTLTAFARVPDDHGDQIAVINVGDSRTYLFRGGELSQVTTDHSLVEEMVRAGELSAEQAETHPRRNILTRALGIEPTVEVEVDYLVPQDGDRILLCSDGLVREVGDDQIAATLRRLKNPDDACRELVAQAKANGGHDNITVVLVDAQAVEDLPIDTQKPSEHAKPRKMPAKKPEESMATRRATRRWTFRTILFLLAAASLIALACGSVVWYARSAYYVGLEGEQLVIYQGRPEKVLWFKATLVERTSVRVGDVLASREPDLRAGRVLSSLADARQYIENLQSEAASTRPPGNTNTQPGPSTPPIQGSTGAFRQGTMPPDKPL